MENTVGVWSSRWAARGADAAYAAAQFCDASAGARRRFALCPAYARARGYFYDTDLYACCRGAVEADLQGPSSARLAGRARRTRARCPEPRGMHRGRRVEVSAPCRLRRTMPD